MVCFIIQEASINLFACKCYIAFVETTVLGTAVVYNVEISISIVQLYMYSYTVYSMTIYN